MSRRKLGSMGYFTYSYMGYILGLEPTDPNLWHPSGGLATLRFPWSTSSQTPRLGRFIRLRWCVVGSLALKAVCWWWFLSTKRYGKICFFQDFLTMNCHAVFDCFFPLGIFFNQKRSCFFFQGMLRHRIQGVIKNGGDPGTRVCTAVEKSSFNN